MAGFLDLDVNRANYRACVQYQSTEALYGSLREQAQGEILTALFEVKRLNYMKVLQPNETKMIQVCEVDHPYPPTKVMWSPHHFQNTVPTDHIATSADYLRLWSVTDEGIALRAVVYTKSEYATCAPLTSLDWNQAQPEMIGTSSVDTTCTIWDLNNITAPKQQIIAHDDEVYDMAFSNNPHMFGSVGADASLRLFDLRALETSSILYESRDRKSLLRIAWNQLDAQYVAAILEESSHVVVLDLRNTSCPVFELSQHSNFVNSIAWSTHSRHHLTSAGEDCLAILYDLSGSSCSSGNVSLSNSYGSKSDVKYSTQIEDSNVSGAIPTSVLFRTQSPINQIRWSSGRPNCVSIAEDHQVYAIEL
ncbi:unnamed protein product [Albugo candida]|uniref:Uncharacterized protein n=1 Tax=Albugo candida TaxID=65357 RepID=A0A024FZ16_9STRA|nr:unnamed protein product [Albugo candida]|eukprot:CCI39662.1 unnamed protein product [Albugo candida]